MNDAAAHPPYCSAAHCQANRGPGGFHWSMPRHVEPTGPGGPLIEVSLFQPSWDPLSEPPGVELRLTHTDSGGRITAVETHEMDPGQMRDLAAVLVEVATSVDAARKAATSDDAPSVAAEQS